MEFKYDGFCHGEPIWVSFFCVFVYLFSTRSDLLFVCVQDYWLAWNTTTPRLTQCFQKTIPIWIPALFLWLLAPWDIYYTLRQRLHTSVIILPNFYNITRLLLTTIIVLTNIVKFTYDLYYFFTPDPTYQPTMAAVFASVIQIFTFALFGILIHIQRCYGYHTSVIAWLFMFLEFIFSLPVVYMYAMFYGDSIVLIDPFMTGYQEWNCVDLYTFYVHFIGVWLLFVMTCFADKRRVHRVSSVESLKNVAENGVAMESLLTDGKPRTKDGRLKECPQSSASYCSDLTYWWFNSMAYLGFRKTLVLDDLWDLNPEDLTVNLSPKFDSNWNGRKCKKAREKKQLNEEEEIQFSKQCQEGGTVSATVGTFGFYLLGTVIFKFIHDCLQFVSPQLLK